MNEEQARRAALLLRTRDKIDESLSNRNGFISQFRTAIDWSSGSAGNPYLSTMRSTASAGEKAAETAMRHMAESQIRAINKELESLGVEVG